MKATDLDTIIQEFPDAARECVGDLHDHILEAAAQALAQSQDSESGGKPKVTVSLKLVIGLNTQRPNWQVKAGVGVNYAAESEAKLLDDPRQPKLPFSDLPEGASVTITAGDTSATIHGKAKGGKKS